VSTKVARSLEALIETEVGARRERLVQKLRALARAERSVTYTNNHYFSHTIASFKEEIKKGSEDWKHGRFVGAGPDSYGDLPSEFMDAVARGFHSASNTEMAAREMQITLFAYGKVVQKRFCDTVSILVINELVNELVYALPALASGWTAQLLEDLVEEKQISSKRKELERSLAGLEAARRELQAL